MKNVNLWNHAKAFFEPLFGNVSHTFQTTWKYIILETLPTGHANHSSAFLGQVRAFLADPPLVVSSRFTHVRQ